MLLLVVASTVDVVIATIVFAIVADWCFFYYCYFIGGVDNAVSNVFSSANLSMS